MNAPIFRAIMALAVTSSGGDENDLPSPGVPLLDRMLTNTGGAVEIVHVTNLNASGAGSFADAVTGGSSAVTRIVVFDVSGECLLPKVQFDTRDNITISRDNLWIAGQTAPDPGDGSGRGFTLRGRLKVRAETVVVEHIRIRPISGTVDPNGANDEDGRGLLITPNVATNGAGPKGPYAVRNVSIQWTQDVIGAAVTLGDGSGNIAYPDRQILDNCLFAEPLNWNIATQQGDYEDGHSYGFNSSEGAHGTSFRGTLFASCMHRHPQFTQEGGGNVVNCYSFNFGVPDSGTRPWDEPMFWNTKTGGGAFFDTAFPEGDMRGIIVNAASNYAEAGNRTVCPSPYHFLNPDSLPGTWPGPLKYYDDGGNLFVSWYDMSQHPGALWNDENAALMGAPQVEATMAVPDLAELEILPEPYGAYALPSVVYAAADARRHCLDHAGAWPAARDAADARIIAEVEARTHSAVGASVEDTPVSTVTGQPPTIPDDPGDGVPFDTDTHPLGTVEANGLTRLENWLVDLHVAAGGCPETAYLAGEWWQGWAP